MGGTRVAIRVLSAVEDERVASGCLFFCAMCSRRRSIRAIDFGWGIGSDSVEYPVKSWIVSRWLLVVGGEDVEFGGAVRERLGLGEGEEKDVGRGRGVWVVGTRSGRGRGVGEGEGEGKESR